MELRFGKATFMCKVFVYVDVTVIEGLNLFHVRY